MLQNIPEERAQSVEEHLLICESCCQGLDRVRKRY
ncbi:MAG: hypothetical protein JO097_18965 [Acidobacteriaceae bacterium]|nr:hypothetical protein [Acidobacteriaceae bacterium]